GIGVELLGPATVSELTLTSSISDAIGTTGGGITKLGSRRMNLQGDGTYTGAVNINEGVLRAQKDSALGTASSGTSSGTETYTNTTTSIGTGISEVQTLTVTGAVGTYRLVFQGQQTNPIAQNALASQVQAELNLLPGIINGGGGFVTVN